MKTTFFFAAAVLVLSGCSNDSSSVTIPDDLPDVAAATFTTPTNITNTYYGPGTGQTYVYAGGEPGSIPTEEIRIERSATTKTVMGVNCIIHHDVVYLNGVIIEDTDDWLAQDDNGNLWYFGESAKNYDNSGHFIDDDGSWESGVDNALPGYWIPATLVAGQTYHQEFYHNEAEDQAEVLAVGETVTIGLGTYQNCVVTKDFSRFESNIYEKKYYAPGIGEIKEEEFNNGVLTEVIELTQIIP